MSLIVDNSIRTGFVSGELNETKQAALGPLPDDLVSEVFSHLNLATLGAICCVSKQWKQLASDPFLWKTVIFRELAFGNDKWAKCFGDDVVKDEDRREEFSSLPLDIVDEYKRFQSAFPEINAKDSLMLVRLPKTLNGQLTIKSFVELAEKYFLRNRTLPCLVDELGDKSIDESRWVLMTKRVLPGSNEKKYAEQQDIVCKLAQKGLVGYEIPETLEVTVCFLAQYIDLNLFFKKSIEFDEPDHPLMPVRTFTRCQENIQGFRDLGRKACVGFLSLRGLLSFEEEFAQTDYIGVAAVRRL